MQTRLDFAPINLTQDEKHPNVTQVPLDSEDGLLTQVSKRQGSDLYVSKEETRWEGRNDTSRDDAISDSLAQLAKSPLDLKQWINAALLRLDENDKLKNSNTNWCEDGNSPAPGADVSSTISRSEVFVDRLITRVQSHAQNVGNSVEELISQTAVRLPRSILELSRMINETREVTNVLESLQDTVKSHKGNASSLTTRPSSVTGGEEYVQRLHELKGTQTKLKRCLNVLSKATAVNTNMEKISKAIGRSALHRFSNAPEGAEVDKLKKSHSALTNVISLIQQVQHDLQDLRKVDPVYGEKHRIALEQYEQILVKMLEHECVERLVRHQAESAVEFFQPLKLIGKMDAVLASYTKRVGHAHVERIQQAFCIDGEKVEPSRVCPSRVADIIQKHLVPSINDCLNTEFDFLCELEVQTAAYQFKMDAKSCPTLLDATPSQSRESTSHPCSYSSEGKMDAENEGKELRSSIHLTNDAPDTAVMMHAMGQILHLIGDALDPLLSHLLPRVPTSQDLIHCYKALCSITMSGTPTANSKTTATAGTITATATAGTGTGGFSAGGGQRAEEAAEATCRARRRLTAAFEAAAVQEAFCSLTDARLRNAAGSFSFSFSDSDPHRALLSPPIENEKEKLKNEESEAEGLRCLRFPNSVVIGRLAEALGVNLREVLHFLPEATAAVCVKRWHDTLARLLLNDDTGSRKSDGNRRGRNGNNGNGGSGDADPSQAVLVRLHATTRCVRPALLMLQREAEAVLTAAESHHAGTMRRLLSDALWGPLLAATEATAAELQAALKHIILQPVLAKAAHYGKLPIWHPKRPSSFTREEEWPQQQQQQQQHSWQWLLAANVSPSHVTPSEPVRELGEAILEIPLKLEALRAASIDVLSGKTTDVSSPFAVSDCLDELFFEETESWLDGIVHAAVEDFVKNKVLQVEVDFSDLRTCDGSAIGTTAEADGEATDELLKRGVSITLQQLLSDLDYMKNVLSAVSDDHFDNVDEVLVKLNTLLSTWEVSSMFKGEPFKVSKLISKAAE